MAFNAGSVQAILEGKFNPASFLAFDAQMKKSAAGMATFEKQTAASSARSSAALGKLGSAAKTGAAVGIFAVGAALVSSAKEAIAFEKAMRNVNTIARVSDRELKGMSKTILDLAGKTAQAPKTLAAGLYDIVSSGFKGKDAMTILEKSAYAASAGMTDTATSTKAVVAVLNAYGLGADQAGKVADQLFGIVDRGVISFEELARQIGDVLPFGNQLGVGLDQLGASVATLTKGGMPSAIAMTALKGALVAFIRPSKEMAAAVHEAGYANGEALIKARGFQGALEAVSKASGGTASAMTGLFPDVQGLAGALALTGAKAKDARADLDAMGDVTGKTGKAFAEQSKSTAFQMAQLKTNLSVLGTEVGTALLPALNDATKAFAKFVGEINSGTGSGGQFIKDLTHDLDGLLGFLTTVNDAVVIFLKGVNMAFKIGTFGLGPDLVPESFIERLERGNGALNDFRKNSLRPIKLSANVGEAVDAIDKLDGKKIKQKVARIIANGDTTVAQKIKALVALGIPLKTAKVITAGIPKTLAELHAVQSALGGINSKSITISMTTLKRTIDQGGSITKTPPVKGLKKEATGSAGGYARTALVGEGHGPELVTDGRTSLVVDRPTLMDLGPEHAVIPYGDRNQQGRALGLMLDLFGIHGYAKGKPAKKKATRKSLPIPAAVRFGAVPEDELNTSRDQAREAYQKRKKRVHDIDVDIRDQRKRVGEAKAGPAKRKAQAKLNDLQRDRKRYNDGGSGYTSLAKMRKQWQDLQRQATALRVYNRDIERLNTLQETDRTKMATASKLGDATAWGTAKDNRDKLLATLRDKYARALKLAKNPNFKADLEQKLASIEGEIADSAADAFIAESPFDGGLSKAEQQRLAELQRDQSLAALTQGLGDDEATAGATLGFLEQMLSAAQADPARGGASAVRDLADQVKQARDNVASFAGGGSAGNDNADLAAQLAQRDEQLRVAKRESEINARSLSVFQGTGDLGSAAWRPGITQNIYTLHPGDPATQRAISDAAVSGMDQQASRQSPRSDPGL